MVKPAFVRAAVSCVVARRRRQRGCDERRCSVACGYRGGCPRVACRLAVFVPSPAGTRARQVDWPPRRWSAGSMARERSG